MTLLKPPILTGDTQNDLYRLRDYLFQLSNTLEAAATAPAAQNTGGSAGTDKATVAAVRKSAQELRDLIAKSADRVEQESRAYTDGKTAVYDSRYLAQSDFGTYEESMESRMNSMAGQIEETFSRSETLSNDLAKYTTLLEGEIRRGIVADPDNPGQYVLGIAISSNLQFTGEVYHGTDADYYYLVPGQTFGLYTSSGWQFWVNGYKKGYYNSLDEKLHVRDIVSEDSLQIGADWQLRALHDSQELEFMYVGSGA